MDSREGIEIGDKVKCNSKSHFYYGREGVVSGIHQILEKYILVDFNGPSVLKTSMHVNSLELINHKEEYIEWIAEKK